MVGGGVTTQKRIEFITLYKIMAEENIEETIDNLGEGETPIEETPIGEEETPETPPQAPSELEKKNKELYARARKAEEEAKRLKADLAQKGQPSMAEPDVFDLAKTVSSLRDFSEQELDFIAIMAKAKNLTPQEAAKTEEAKLYVAASREKVARENKIPSPSSLGGASFDKKVSSTMKEEEVDLILQERFKEAQRKQTGV